MTSFWKSRRTKPVTPPATSTSSTLDPRQPTTIIGARFDRQHVWTSLVPTASLTKTPRTRNPARRLSPDPPDFLPIPNTVPRSRLLRSSIGTPETDFIQIPPLKRRHSDLSISTAQPVQIEPQSDPGSPSSAAPSSTTESRPRSAPNPKKRPKTANSDTPNSTDAAPTSRATSSLPRPLHPTKPVPAKALRSITNANANPTARHALSNLINNGANTPTRGAPPPASQFVVEDDSPLPKVPRIGMGEEQAAPPLSDIRTEAQLIIQEAARRREADARAAKRRARSNKRNGHRNTDGRMTPPPTGGPRDDDDYDEDGDILTPPQTSYYNGATYAAGPSSYAKYDGDPQIIYDMTMYDATINDNKTFGQRPLLNDPRPPKFKKGQEETVILAPNGHRPKARDLVERMHEDGFEGLTLELEADAAGFVDNVKSNLRAILDASFPQPSARRDAFLEKIGRGLADLGWRMTDTSDAAF